MIVATFWQQKSDSLNYLNSENSNNTCPPINKSVYKAFGKSKKRFIPYIILCHKIEPLK